MALMEEDWKYYFYYIYLEGRGPQFIFGTDDEVAASAEANPDKIFFASQEEIYPLWMRIDDQWYRVGDPNPDEYKYYYAKYDDPSTEPLLMIAASPDEMAYFAEWNRSIIVFGTNEALDPEHTFVARATMARNDLTP